ncbi:FAD/FMN-containing dehydrogenase [Franzmannia pantelleriensis]|uniref:FAD/FMN-containing dehydrogenase n=1 Tax=Franzmannia pantelleriensis TaxID=48727 RepID=A0A1G9ET87_9GAMM|nr:FAD-binding oxidoreductase [Halomonas pantelleriensis]SDK79376.1 FAD/FMN-containing dehydrogenase [Halomonas pantelleriensis]
MMPRSWNRLPRVDPDRVELLTNRSQPLDSNLPRPLLAYGNGRSYGDVCLTERGTLMLTRGLDRFIDFDPNRGVLRCEAGVTLAEILALVVPRGWFLPSTPGTRLATVGGAVANDVHGKNHHALGSFGHHVRALELWRSDGRVIECYPEEGNGWFRATIGGLGLTGLIRWVELQLIPIQNTWMWVESQRFANLDEFWTLSRRAEALWPYTVAWIDCLAKGKAQGRGILLAGQHAAAQAELPVFKEGSKRMLFDPPFSLVNGLSLRVFNALYYRQSVKPQGGLSHYVPYFYPLDAIQDWNRIYGRSGFYQYQCVVPPREAEAAIPALLDTITRHGEGSFLAVLKTFGPMPSLGMLSFPRPGTTLALDFPNRGDKTRRLLDKLDAIVREAGGTLYPGKDARMPASLFQSGYPEWEAFKDYVDPDFSSRFWQRVTS